MTEEATTKKFWIGCLVMYRLPKVGNVSEKWVYMTCRGFDEGGILCLYNIFGTVKVSATSPDVRLPTKEELAAWLERNQ